VSDTNGEPNDSLLPEWLRGKRQAWIMTALLWIVAATIYWVDMESASDTGDLAVAGVFTALALYYLVMAFADGSHLREQARICCWSWGG